MPYLEINPEDTMLEEEERKQINDEGEMNQLIHPKRPNESGVSSKPKGEVADK